MTAPMGDTRAMDATLAAVIGGDPYDALRSPLARMLGRTRRLRQLLIQSRKRLPLPGSAFGLQSFAMAKSVACRLIAESRRAGAGEDGRDVEAWVETLSRAENLARLGDGAWGYEFDVQTRWSYYPAGSPNIIATYFAARAYLQAWAATGQREPIERAEESGAFMVRDLLRTGERTSFAYNFGSDRLVHNANLLGAGLVAAMGRLLERAEWLAVAREAAEASLEAQRDDGSWPYGEGGDLGWADNFHTAYVLDGLLLLWLATRDAAVRAALERGVEFWTTRFFGPNGEPRYFPDQPRPYDIHSAATAVDVGSRLAAWDFADEALPLRVAEWTRAHLVAPNGRTYFQAHRLWTDKRTFPRWGDAHWALAEASLCLLAARVPDSLEAAVHHAGGAT